MNVPLYEGERVRLALLDPEREAEIESRWTHDPEYLRLSGAEPARPLSPIQIKKRYETAEKKAKEESMPSAFTFAIRTRIDDRLIGIARLKWIMWSHGWAWFEIGIGDPKDRGQGYGSEALRLILRYAFDELNLFRLTAVVPGYNLGALRFLDRHGFAIEVRRREALHRDGQRWDLVQVGLLREDWLVRQPQEGQR